MPGYLDRVIENDLSIGEIPQNEDGKGIITDDHVRIKAAKETMEVFRGYLDSLQQPFDDAVKWWKWYMVQKKTSHYKPWEYWRGKVALPWFYEATETAVGHMHSQVFATDPPIRPERRLNSIPMLEEKMKEWFKFCFRKNAFLRGFELAAREMYVQGAAYRKNTLIEKWRETIVFPSEAQAQEFDQALEGAVMSLGATPPTPDQFEDQEGFRKGFEQFRQMINSAGAAVPELPIAGPRRVTHYRGPGWKNISYWSYYYDVGLPYDQQEVIMIHSLVPETWVTSRTGDGPEYAFDPYAVAYGLDKGAGAAAGTVSSAYSVSGNNQWEQQLRDSMNQVESQTVDRRRHKRVEVVECFWPTSPIPYRVVLNGAICINKRKTNPFEHADFPITALVNLNLPFTSSGLSAFNAGESIMTEANTLRGLRIDGVKMAVLPIFGRMRDSGLSDLAKFIIPGAILDQARARGSLTQVSQVQMDMSSFRELSEMRTEVDGAVDSYPQARGALGPTAVTATQSERAYQGMSIKSQLKVHRIEDDLVNIGPQWLSIAHQFYKETDIASINKLLTSDMQNLYAIEDFSRAIEMDWQFNGSRTQANKELEVQNLKDLHTLAFNSGSRRINPDALLEKIVEKVDPTLVESVRYTEEERKMMEEQDEEQSSEQQSK